ncbi:Tyrosine-protein phosphatase YwqE [Apilactobacillus kunkeei]|nr:Tyrosine-protein phosphatase YwqE [Apilactobacillus kunkeei]CAI2649397.1 Tyrosine-protein phosphatase YwqE [Apilactobacillus kunkeei]CAI2803196.1 Tyrosine-protein phosphatase YwqE [Apilactobacillus kunkeei]
MIDLHCHILPCIDDGSNSIDLSIKMAKQAEREGVKKILATPHHMDGEYINHKKNVIRDVKNLQMIFWDNGIDIELRAGQEVHMNGDLLKSIDNDDVLFDDISGVRYMMLEFPHFDIPEYSKDIIFQLKLRGITPIIVHPERNTEFQKRPEKLYDFVSQGCLTQITATSYVGGFGKEIQKFSDKIVEAGLGFMFSSDAHNLEGRRFRMQEAFERLSKKMGDEFMHEYDSNATRVWNGQKVEIGKIHHIKKDGKIKKILSALF